MANFFLIDHSLRKAGGHHFDYVRCVARAANEQGFLTSIGTHRSLATLPTSDAGCLDRLGSVRRVFHQTTYQPDSYLAGLQHLTRSKTSAAINTEAAAGHVRRAWGQLRFFKHRRRRDKFVRQFAKDCERFFQPAMHTPDDHVFMTTISELELMGLALYLDSNPKSLQAQWHLQFHYNLFDGRTPEYDSQGQTLKAVRACFQSALARIPYHSVHLYATSEQLIQQYGRLGMGEFEVLPYPVSKKFEPVARGSRTLGASAVESPVLRVVHSNQEVFHKSFDPVGSRSESDAFDSESEGMEMEFGRNLGEKGSSTDSIELGVVDEFHRPLRITCPGELRREKGAVEYLQPLVNSIWDSQLSTGNVQIVVQRPARKTAFKKSKIDLETPETISGQPSPIEYYSHPLGEQEYVELIKSSDCGLLFYDSRVYFSRRAGVLGELLSCGKPVIVPAGSWLADQIQTPVFHHVEKTLRCNELIVKRELRDLDWNSSNVPMSGGVVSFDQASHPFEFSIDREPAETAVVLQFEWHWPTEAGVYCRVDAAQRDRAGNVISNQSRVLGHRRANQKISSLFPLEPDTATVEFSLRNAFHHSTANVKRLEVSGIDLPSREDRPAVGAVGIIASDQNHLPDCIDEFVNHFEHYQQSAKQFSSKWYKKHDPKRTLDHLLTANRSVRRAA